MMLGSAFTRRSFVASALASVSAAAMGKVPLSIRVASNQGVENAALQQLMADSGIGSAMGLSIELVESRTVSGPMEAVMAGRADLCMVSAYAGLLPAIERGAELRLIGAGMQRTALALYAGRGSGIRQVRDLAGRNLGIGSDKGLLHVLTLALLRRRGVDPARVHFTDCGSNAQVFEAVASGKVDAGLSGMAAMGGGAEMLRDGRLWQALPHYIYQPAYASLTALSEAPEAVARCLAAYTRLYRHLTSRASHGAYLAARQKVAPGAGPAEGEAVWRFIQAERPYALHPGLASASIAATQQINLDCGVQSRLLPMAQIYDPRPAAVAARLLGRDWV